MDETTGELEIRIRDGTVGVVTRNQLCTDAVWPLKLPDNRGVPEPSLPRCEGVAWEPGTTSTRTGGIMMAFSSRVEGYKFSDAGGTGLKVSGKPSEVIKSLMHTFLEGHPRFGR